MNALPFFFFNLIEDGRLKTEERKTSASSLEEVLMKETKKSKINDLEFDVQSGLSNAKRNVHVIREVSCFFFCK